MDEETCTTWKKLALPVAALIEQRVVIDVHWNPIHWLTLAQPLANITLEGKVVLALEADAEHHDSPMGSRYMSM